MSLLTMIQDVAALVGIPKPASIITSADANVQQLLALAQEEGDELQSRCDWQALTMEFTFTTVAAAAQPNAVASDWSRFLADSFWNRSTNRPIKLITPQQWQEIQARPQSLGIFLCFRERGGVMLATPTPPAGQTIAYEYVSQSWVQGSDGRGKPRYTADDDTAYLSEPLMKLGIRWRYRKTKGLDYAEDFRTYQEQADQACSADGGNRTLDVAGAPLPMRPYNIPDGNWGL